MVNAGWLQIYGKEAETDDTPALVPVGRQLAEAVAENTIADFEKETGVKSTDLSTSVAFLRTLVSISEAAIERD